MMRPVDEYDRPAERMYNIVSRLPGFQSVKSFRASDGEEMTVFRFASEEALEAAHSSRTCGNHEARTCRILRQRVLADLQGDSGSRPV
jgi:heme-degrading monooxygenase HmoA